MSRAGITLLGSAAVFAVVANPVRAVPQQAVPPMADSPVEAPAPAGAQAVAGRELEQQVRQVASQLRCVVCQGLSIQDSPSELARQMKAVVREQLAAGRSPDEVKRYFVDKYGEWILLAPEPEGFNLAVYLLPVVALLAGAGVVVVAVRRWTAPAADDERRAGAGAEPAPHDRERETARR